MKPNPASMIGRMKPLPRRHRLAHLRALIRQQPIGSTRREQLAALLRRELSAPPAWEGRAI
jgi:hypothetical protein